VVEPIEAMWKNWWPHLPQPFFEPLLSTLPHGFRHFHSFTLEDLSRNAPKVARLVSPIFELTLRNSEASMLKNKRRQPALKPITREQNPAIATATADAALAQA
jgi:hypothetical protein